MLHDCAGPEFRFATIGHDYDGVHGASYAKVAGCVRKLVVSCMNACQLARRVRTCTCVYKCVAVQGELRARTVCRAFTIDRSIDRFVDRWTSIETFFLDAGKSGAAW